MTSVSPRVRRRQALAAAIAAALLAAIAALVVSCGGSSDPPHSARRASAGDPARPLGAAPSQPPAAASARAPQPAVPPQRVQPVRQLFHNDCEATALSMLLRTRGVRIGQLALQALLPRSQPIDQQTGPRGPIWGDPETGYVGRPDGVGFGVYQGPVIALARRYARGVVDLSGAPLGSILARLRSGHAVMAWVALADGPYESWTTPAGRSVTVDLNEHALLLVGVGGDGSLLADDPLTGTRRELPQALFLHQWSELGRRAISA